MQLAGAGAPVAKAPMSFPDERPAQFRGEPVGGAAASAPGSAPRRSPPPASMAAASLPADFDAAGFERIAKMIFIRLQAANDVGDLNDLRAFTTPEMFAAIKLDLQERGAAAQRTDVVRVDAEVLDVASEADRQIVSVRFHGLIREEVDGVARSRSTRSGISSSRLDGSREWAIAGIQPVASAPRCGLKAAAAHRAIEGPSRPAVDRRRGRARARLRRRRLRAAVGSFSAFRPGGSSSAAEVVAPNANLVVQGIPPIPA